MQVVPLSNFDLCLHNVDTGNLLGNGVFNLNAGVNLDEVELAVGSSQKFYGAGADDHNNAHDDECQNTDRQITAGLCQNGLGLEEHAGWTARAKPWIP